MRLKSFVNVLDQGIAGLPSPLWAQRLATIARTGYLRICGSVGHASHAVAAIIIVANCFAAAPANPSSLSILEEVSFTTVMAAGPVFNGLVVFDPMQPIGGIDTVIPELAETWSWDETGTKLTFKLRQGVKWHDGKPFTAKDVQCTWHWLNGKTDDYFRKNPRRVWWTNLKEVTVNGDHR